MPPKTFEINDIVNYSGLKYRVADRFLGGTGVGEYTLCLAGEGSSPNAIPIKPIYVLEKDVRPVVAVTETTSRQYKNGDKVTFNGMNFTVVESYKTTSDGGYQTVFLKLIDSADEVINVDESDVELFCKKEAMTCSEAPEPIDYTKIENIRIGMPFWYDGKKHEVNNMRRLETAPGKFIDQVSGKGLTVFVNLDLVSFVEQKEFEKKTFYFASCIDPTMTDTQIRFTSRMYPIKVQAKEAMHDFKKLEAIDVQFHEIELEVEV